MFLHTVLLTVIVARYNNLLLHRAGAPKEPQQAVDDGRCRSIFSSRMDSVPLESDNYLQRGTFWKQRLTQLKKTTPSVFDALEKVDALPRLSALLNAHLDRNSSPPSSGRYEIWETVGYDLLHERRRIHEALGLLWELYERILKEERSFSVRVHKGMVLVLIGDCFHLLGYPVHAKRYLMLTLCEDAVTHKGVINPHTLGVYWRLVWRHGLAPKDVQNFAKSAFDSAQGIQTSDELQLFPESVLMELGHEWMTEFPSSQEVMFYRINCAYARQMLSQIAEPSGKKLEALAEYLMACIPGCRTRRAVRNYSTDYDIICTLDGVNTDFRSELGRYFVCECKDWNRTAGFSEMAKFARVLQSVNARFGIFFTRQGISGKHRTTDAARERLKIYQQQGLVIITIDLCELEEIASGGNLMTLLRRQYEAVRLDLIS